MEAKKYLPLGTVCRLKDGKKNLMIIGFCQSPAENPDSVYDYNGCMYPEGVVSPEINFLFNHNQIEEILFNGFVNDEEVLFKQRLNEFLTTGKFDGKDINIDSNGNITLYNNEIINIQNMDSNSKNMISDTLNRVQNMQNSNNNLGNNSSLNSTLTTTPNLNTLNLDEQNDNQ